MTLFETAVNALELTGALNDAKKTYTAEKLEQLLSTIGLGLADSGDVLDSSMQNPRNFMKVTDALHDWINNNLDSYADADALLSALLDTEIMSADCFIPSLHVDVGGLPGNVTVSYAGIGLTLGLFGTFTHLELSRETLLDDILDEETEVRFLGRISLYDDGRVVWTPYVEQPIETVAPSASVDSDLTIPYQPVANESEVARES